MQEPNSNKSRPANPSVDQTKRPKTAHQKKLEAVGGPGRPTDLPGRPTDLPGRPTWPVGPTASTRAHGTSPLVPYVGCAGFTPWLLAINTRGVENRTHTHTTHLSSLAFLAQSLGLVEFRRSQGVIESPELLESLVWVHL